MKRPADQLYWKDWLGDAGLQACSPSTRGIWANFLAYMFLDGECGKLVKSRTELMRLGHCNGRQLRRFFAELCAHKFADFTVHENEVTIINRRMHRIYLQHKKDRDRKKSDKIPEKFQTHSPIPIPIPIGIDKNNNDGVLDLDLAVAQGRDFFMSQISRILKPNKTEAVTFARITRHLVALAQSDATRISLFADAVEWAKQARASPKTKNPKALFVAKIKKETGFKAQTKLL